MSQDNITANNKRIPYIDVAKGLLILLVVYDHLPDIYIYKLMLFNTHIIQLDNWQWIYKLYFMPAFFCITGICSNFSVNFFPFLKKNFKSLILPNILLGLLLNNDWGGAILRGGSFWFLSALFVAKLLYWILYTKFSNNFIIRFSFLIVLTFIGFALNGIPSRYDIYFFHYAFCLVIFLEIGRLINTFKNIYLFLTSILYVILCFTMFFAEIHKPVVALGCNCTVVEIPLYLVSATTGSCLILLLAKKIKENKILQFFGVSSLTFYIFQFKVMYVLENSYLKYYIIHNWCSTLCFVLIIYVTSVWFLSIISYIINTKYLSFLIGKF